MANYNKPLPDCEGPKLPLFHHAKAPIRFRRLVSDLESEGHGHVFEVSINSKVYALKVVRPAKASTDDIEKTDSMLYDSSSSTMMTKTWKA